MKMIKRTISTVLVLLMVLALAGCGSNNGGDSGSGGSGSGGSGAEVSLDSLKTMGDAFALETEEDQWAVYEGKVVYAFKAGDTYYRVRASIPEDEQQAYWDIEFDDEEAEAKQHAIIDPLEIEQVENLSEQMLTQDELNALVGKTGQELVDEGWEYTGSYNLVDMLVWMTYGPFEYSITFDGSTDEPNNDDFDIEATTQNMKVKSAEFSMLGDATDVE